MKKLNVQQRKYLKGEAHNQKPVVTIGNNGLTPSVIEEINLSLAHHELIKIKLPAGEKSLRLELLDSIARQTRSGVVNLIGRVGIIFRQNKESKFTLPR